MEPLAIKIRPQTLDEFVGQKHLVGEGKPLREAMKTGHLFSFILWGPPGVGKTSLARLYAKALKADMFELSAVSAGKKEVREIVKKPNFMSRPKVLFLDEIHRFNKAQQDFLLPYVESGELVLIGATTENPSFEVIAALLSRLRVFVLKSLLDDEISAIVRKTGIEVESGAMEFLIRAADGDARQALTLLDDTKKLYQKVTVEALKEAMQSKRVRYDKKGEEHYNLISAFIKSMRAGDENATIYYLARMIEGGEEPKFIARRMVVFASEDIGLAQPNALLVANEVFRAVEIIGLPEGAINLAQGAIYLANAKKDRGVYEALRKAQADAQKYGNLPVPMRLRNAPTKLMREVGYGEGYEMYDKEGILPEELKNRRYFKKA